MAERGAPKNPGRPTPRQYRTRSLIKQFFVIGWVGGWVGVGWCAGWNATTANKIEAAELGIFFHKLPSSHDQLV